MSKKILVPGGTGAMGVYLVPELLKLGYQVDVIYLEDVMSGRTHWPIEDPRLKVMCANAMDYDSIAELLKKDYDGVVDFMIYSTPELFEKFLPLYLKNVGHYIYLSTYRVYANEEHPVRETSPRLLDVSKDEVLLHSGDYCIYKAQGEEFLKDSGYDNWTAIRPAITYSKRRFQLVTMEMNLVVRRMLEGKTLLLPEPAMGVQATMSWAGDVAKMISRLVCNPKACREIYSVCTAEHHTWKEIADIYARIGALKYQTVDTETFLNVMGPGKLYARQQLVYDRYFDRIMDNSKILTLTGIKQSELMPLEKGLAMELSAFPRDFAWRTDEAYARMDEMLLSLM